MTSFFVALSMKMKKNETVQSMTIEPLLHHSGCKPEWTFRFRRIWLTDILFLSFKLWFFFFKTSGFELELNMKFQNFDPILI